MNFRGFTEGMLHVQEDAVRCRACGHVFYHVWTGAGKPAVERFPIECPGCGKVEGYRIDEDELAELTGDDE